MSPTIFGIVSVSFSSAAPANESEKLPSSSCRPPDSGFVYETLPLVSTALSLKGGLTLSVTVRSETAAPVTDLPLPDTENAVSAGTWPASGWSKSNASVEPSAVAETSTAAVSVKFVRR